MRIGLFFGSFNPIHIGHLILAEYFACQPELDQVWLVVSPQNPLKQKSGLLDQYHRLDLVRRAVWDNDHLMVSDIEFRLPIPSYTIDTMAYLSEKHPEHEFSIIMGEDNLATLSKWKNYETLIELYAIWVYPRVDAQSIPEELRYHPHVKLVSAPRIELSSTMVRQNIRQGKSVRYMLPEQIHDFVVKEQFYRS